MTATSIATNWTNGFDAGTEVTAQLTFPDGTVLTGTATVVSS